MIIKLNLSNKSFLILGRFAIMFASFYVDTNG